MESDQLIDNLSQQVDEVEALASIFEDGWCVEDESSRRYAITICDDREPANSDRTVIFKFHLPDEYPSTAPPQFELKAAWLRGGKRRELESQLADVYCENIGMPVIFSWVDKIREFLREIPSSQEVPEVVAEQEKRTASPESPVAEPVEEEEEEEFDLEEVLKSCVPYSDADAADSSGDACPEIFHGEFLRDRKSVFQGHLALVNTEREFRMVMDKLLENKKIAEATHNIFAYRIKMPNTKTMNQHCADDGEHTAGGRLLHLLQILEAENVAVIVTRWYGGIHLGQDRFKHINNCARNMLEQHGFIKYKEGKKTAKKGKKGK